MEIPSAASPSRADSTKGSVQGAVPFVIGMAYFFMGLFFVRPNMGEPDSYREALSALQYIDSGTYGSYWDHPLTMYVFVAATRCAHALGWSQIATLNTLAIVLGSISVWPFYHSVRKLANWQTAAFASAALILSPAFIRFSTYLSHEITGFALASWSIYFLLKTLESRSRTWALAFGFCFASTWSARPNGAIFLALPLLILTVHEFGRKDFAVAMRLFCFASLGFSGCILLVYRPALIMHLTSRSGRFFFTFYEFGRYAGSTTLAAMQSATPALVILSTAGCIALFLRKRRLIALFSVAWIMVAYVFYTGMYSVHRYFLVLLPPLLMLSFAGADALDDLMKRRFGHSVKTAVFLLLLLVSLWPNLPDLLYLRNVDDDRLASETTGQLVGRNLLFTTADGPMIRYYNYESPPEIVYLVTEYTPGRLTMKVDALRLAQERLRMGMPVFATEEIVEQLEHAGVEARYDLVWEYKRMRLYRLSSLRFDDRQAIGNGTV
ncbi:glycosyltransferase family 39 protein [Candidatus Poribacteria bacterium]|nr:glycosyltransferase family 39 protein [Candidatus Poribacteria bacterium]